MRGRQCVGLGAAITEGDRVRESERFVPCSVLQKCNYSHFFPYREREREKRERQKLVTSSFEPKNKLTKLFDLLQLIRKSWLLKVGCFSSHTENCISEWVSAGGGKVPRKRSSRRDWLILMKHFPTRGDYLTANERVLQAYFYAGHSYCRGAYLDSTYLCAMSQSVREARGAKYHKSGEEKGSTLSQEKETGT